MEILARISSDMEEYNAYRQYMHNIISANLITIESRNYAPPPFVQASIGQIGEGAYLLDSDIYMWWPLSTEECHVGVRSLHLLWLFDGQKVTK